MWWAVAPTTNNLLFCALRSTNTLSSTTIFFLLVQCIFNHLYNQIYTYITLSLVGNVDIHVNCLNTCQYQLYWQRRCGLECMYYVCSWVCLCYWSWWIVDITAPSNFSGISFLLNVLDCGSIGVLIQSWSPFVILCYSLFFLLCSVISRFWFSCWQLKNDPFYSFCWWALAWALQQLTRAENWVFIPVNLE